MLNDCCEHDHRDVSVHTCPLPDPIPGPSPSLSPPPLANPPQRHFSRSLSDARFNALRQEYNEYRRAQEYSSPHEPCLTTAYDSDSDASSVLL